MNAAPLHWVSVIALALVGCAPPGAYTVDLPDELMPAWERATERLEKASSLIYPWARGECSPGEPGCVTLCDKATLGKGVGGRASNRRRWICLRAGMSAEQTSMVLTHELVHSWGAKAHSTDPASVMFRASAMTALITLEDINRVCSKNPRQCSWATPEETLNSRELEM